MRLRADVYSFQLGGSAVFGGGGSWSSAHLKLHAGSFRRQQDHDAPGHKPLDSKHDPGPLIFLSKGRQKKGTLVKRQEGRGEGKKRERSKTTQPPPEGARFC